MNEFQLEVVDTEGAPADMPTLKDETINMLGSILAPLFLAELEKKDERG